MRVSDYIARFLVEQGVDLVFTITGAGNVRLIEAVHEAGIRYVCPHHEQAALMAAIARHRIHGTPAVCLVTGGPGAANTLIGLADAHLDSLPLVVIAGQERVGFVDPPNALRGKGVQGLDMVHMVSTVTKYAACLTRPTDLRHLLERAFHEATTGRPGPVWVEVPQDLQWASVEPDALLGLTPPVIAAATDMSAAASAMLALVAEARRPLVWVGHGIRLGRCEALFHRVFDALGIPALVSWQGADLIPDDHPLYVGRAGVYGQRWANFALQTCDLLITLGTRLALPQRGYVDAEFAPGARKVIVEIDPAELDKFTFPVDLPVLGDVAEFLAAVDSQLSAAPSTGPRFPAWITQCHDWRDRYPMSVAPAETDEVTAGINSYWFIERLSAALPSDAIVVTDMGTSLTCTPRHDPAAGRPAAAHVDGAGRDGVRPSRRHRRGTGGARPARGVDCRGRVADDEPAGTADAPPPEPPGDRVPAQQQWVSDHPTHAPRPVRERRHRVRHRAVHRGQLPRLRRGGRGV